MGQLSGLEINEHKTFEQIVVKNNVDEKMIRFRTYMELPGHKGKTFTEFQ